MKETGKERFILTKAYEVAYAVFRLAAQMPEKDFVEPLRQSGTALLAAVAAEDHVEASRSLRVMECLVKFGGDVGLVGTRNVDVMTREIYALDAAIGERRSVPRADEVNLAEIFSKPANKPEPVPESAPSAVEPAIMESEPAIRQSANDLAIRQNTILARIRQSGNCRLKDIQELLPDTSERTIRYDIQTLLEHGHIERVGIAGPSVFYRTTHPTEPVKTVQEAG